jgi:phospholipid/cholesterol/gamma-HCH transport system permease protein
MDSFALEIEYIKNKLLLKFIGEFNLYSISLCENKLLNLKVSKDNIIDFDLTEVKLFDTAAAIFIKEIENKFSKRGIKTHIVSIDKDILGTLRLVENEKRDLLEVLDVKKGGMLQNIGKHTYKNYLGFISFLSFLGELFVSKIGYLKNVKNIRYKEIAFEINESAIRALGIIALTSFLIGLVVAYQSAVQLKLYGANIFIVDMLGISILRELAPLMSAIVIAGRSGSAFTAQIGAMKITQELDAMRTMGFDPYIFLVLPRIIALMIAMPILIFISDIMGIFGGMLVANLDLHITTTMFLERFNEVIALKHFVIGVSKGPFFAFLIASIGIYRGMMVKDDTQSIGFNTTKSVVESIFAVIVCDAVFSIIFTNLGI